MKRWMRVFCVGALLLAGCGSEDSPELVAVGNRAPQFSLKSLDGTTVKSSALKGEVVVLNFWATYCQPCRSEIPELNLIAASNEAKVIGISLDAEGEKVIRQFERAENLDFKYTVLLGDEEVFQRFNGVGIPYTLVLDRAQRIVKIYRGPVNRETLERDLAAIKQSA